MRTTPQVIEGVAVPIQRYIGIGARWNTRQFSYSPNLNYSKVDGRAEFERQAWLEARRQRIIDDVNTPHAKPPKTKSIVDSIQRAIELAESTIIDLGVINPYSNDDCSSIPLGVTISAHGM